MAVLVIVYGASGTGKSRSLKDFKRGELSCINVNKKLYPFKADFASIGTSDYKTICEAMAKTASPSIAIDDATYLLTDAFMKSSLEKGYEKFTRMAADFYNLLQFIINVLPNDKIVYLIGHSQTDANGFESFKTIGHLLDEKVCIEGLSTIVLKTCVKDGVYTWNINKNNSWRTKSKNSIRFSN